VAKIKVGKTVESLGEYLREQRVNAQLSLRQLAEQTGVSNPYLSQIERGLHEPSVRVLTSIAEALNVSAETLLEQAGLVTSTSTDDHATEDAIRADRRLTEAQRQALVGVYRSYVEMNAQQKT
jgi:transcriptional regulator with XRE-family HTH domain